MLWVLVLLPGFLFAYEAHDELGNSTAGDTCKSAVGSVIGCITIFLLILLPM